MILATELGLLQRILDTVPLTRDQWLICIGVASSLLVVEEATKFVLRRRQSRESLVGSDEHPKRYTDRRLHPEKHWKADAERRLRYNSQPVGRE